MADIPPTSNELAAQRTEMALGRTIMALERTLMAWFRTALSLISFGFTIYKILQPLAENGTVAMRPNAPRNLGLFLIFLGMALLLVGIIEYLLVGLFTILNILFGLGGF